jgi:mannonate dehydratase
VRIERAEVIVTSPGRNFVTLKLVTSDGVAGYGDATLNGRELAVASYLEDHLLALLIGRDAHRIEDMWQYLYRGAYWRGGPVTMTAISAVDVALWDIKGKVAGLPVHQLLGGPCREGCLAYAHASGRDAGELLESVAAALALGYRAVRVQAGVPQLGTVYGVAAGRDAYEPAARGGRPVEEVWDARAYLRHVPGVFAALRAQLGPQPALLHDVHHRLTALQAAQLGRALEPHDLFWLEDVTPAENPDALRFVRRHTVTPLAVGEVFTTIWDCRTILQDRLVDYVRTSVTHAGGISHVRRILALAELSQIRSGCHGATDISPVGMAAALHLGLAIPNFGIQEHMRHAPLVDEVFPHAYRFADGHLHPGDAPGLGVSLDETLAARHPYVAAYLPVNRLADGTMHDW